MYKRIVLFISVLLLLYIAYSYMSLLKNSHSIEALKIDNEALISQQKNNFADIRKLKLDISLLKQENQALIEIVKSLGIANKNFNEKNLAEEETNNLIKPNNENSQQLNDEDTSSKVTDQQIKFANKMMSDINYDPIKATKEQFEAQDIDFLWASTYENNITELFATTPDLTTLPLKNVSCKSTVCEIAIYADNTDAFGAANLIAKSLANKDWRDKKATFIFNDKAVDGVISFYLGKEEGSLDF